MSLQVFKHKITYVLPPHIVYITKPGERGRNLSPPQTGTGFLPARSNSHAPAYPHMRLLAFFLLSTWVLLGCDLFVAYQNQAICCCLQQRVWLSHNWKLPRRKKRRLDFLMVRSWSLLHFSLCLTSTPTRGLLSLSLSLTGRRGEQQYLKAIAQLSQIVQTNDDVKFDLQAFRNEPAEGGGHAAH